MGILTFDNFNLINNLLFVSFTYLEIVVDVLSV